MEPTKRVPLAPRASSRAFSTRATSSMAKPGGSVMLSSGKLFVVWAQATEVRSRTDSPQTRRSTERSLSIGRDGDGDQLVSVGRDVADHGDGLAVVQELVGGLVEAGQVHLEAASAIGSKAHRVARHPEHPPVVALELLRHGRGDDGQGKPQGHRHTPESSHALIVSCPRRDVKEGYSPRRVGSSTSRSQSPARLITMEVIMRTRPGKVEIHHAESR